MIGRLIKGTRAEPGSVLVAKSMEQGAEQLVVVIPMNPEKGGCVIIVPATGRAYAAPSSRLEDTFWDLTGAVDWGYDISAFNVGGGAPSEGCLGFNADGAPFSAVGEQHTSSWIDLRDGAPAPQIGSCLQFSSWRLVDKSGRVLTEFRPR